MFQVSRSVFAAYAKSVGIATAVFVLLFGLCAKFLLVGTRIWLADWSSKKSVSSEERDKYLMVYGLLGLGHCITTYLSTILLTIGAYFAAKRLHNDLLINVLRCPMQFFESTPMGRLTNRFTKDINVIDEDVPETVNSFIGCLFGIVSVIFTISYSTVLFLAALVPLAAVYIGTQVVFSFLYQVLHTCCLCIFAVDSVPNSAKCILQILYFLENYLS